MTWRGSQFLRNQVGIVLEIYKVSFMWLWVDIMWLYYVYVMDTLYEGISQQNESNVVCNMLGQAWVRHWNQGCLVETVWVWMCGTTIVHMLYMLYMLHLWCCAHAVLCIYSVCTCCLCNVMYKVVHIVLCVYYICSARFRWCYVYVGYAVLCTYHTLPMMDMWCFYIFTCRFKLLMWFAK